MFRLVSVVIDFGFVFGLRDCYLSFVACVFVLTVLFFEMLFWVFGLHTPLVCGELNSGH